MPVGSAGNLPLHLHRILHRFERQIFRNRLPDAWLMIWSLDHWKVFTGILHGGRREESEFFGLILLFFFLASAFG